MERCFDCPRNCGVDRVNTLGYCKEKDKIRIAKVIENFMWEEPCISGEKGALAIFFSGCNLKCSFCQNKEISHAGKGNLYSPNEFKVFIESFDLNRFSCIDLITPSHFSSLLFEAFEDFHSPIPIVWNSSGYEKVETIEKVSRFVDVFLPDFKYFNKTFSKEYSKAENYFDVASKAICTMKKNKPENIFKNGVLQQGLLIRHLVMPNGVKDSMKILDYIKQNIESPFISLMSQFIPLGRQFDRKLYPLEYKTVVSHAEKIGITNGYLQEFSSANTDFIPDF